MPRQNPGREIPAERDLARRIAWERERRGWTYDGLAGRLKAAGCPIQASAIYKIEKADPPRRITVNELVGLSAVFGVPPADLLQSPDALDDPWVGNALRQVEWALRSLNSAVGFAEELMVRAPEKRAALKSLLREFYADWPELKTHLRFALRGERHYADQPQQGTGRALPGEWADDLDLADLEEGSTDG